MEVQQMTARLEHALPLEGQKVQLMLENRRCRDRSRLHWSELEGAADQLELGGWDELQDHSR